MPVMEPAAAQFDRMAAGTSRRIDCSMARTEVAAVLPGRARECAELLDLMVGIGAHPVALIHGEAGVGKTAMLRWASGVATANGMPVVTATGVPTERELPFAALRRLLPRDNDRGRLRSLRRSVDRALEAPESAGSGLSRTAMTTLEYLAELAAPSRLLVVVDDVQWLDRPSRDVLMFLGRRLDPDVRMALAAREDVPGDVAQTALSSRWRTLALERLADRDAAEVLHEWFPELATDVRRRVLDEAAGLPLALKELPTVIGMAPTVHADPVAPLTRRLQAAFASRLAALPEITRRLVLLAAVHDNDDAAELLVAAGTMSGARPTATAWDPAVLAELIELSAGRVSFAHPLVRSATYQGAGPAALRRAHLALAEAAETADRRAWHAAASVDAPDEAVARQLEALGERAFTAGAIEIAGHAYEEAVRLSEERRPKAVRQLHAMVIAEQVGQAQHALDLLGSLDIGALDRAERVRVEWLREVLTDGAWTGGDRARTFAEIARRLSAEGDSRGAADLLLSIALRCWWSNLDPDTSAAVASAADDLRDTASPAAYVGITALADPTARGAHTLETLEGLTLTDIYPDSSMLSLLGHAAAGVGDLPRSVDIFSAAIAESRRQSRITVLAQALVSAAWSDVQIGRLLRAEVAAEEGIRLSRETGHPLWEATGELALAMARGHRGDIRTATALADRAERLFLTTGANPMLAQVRIARGVAALAEGNHAEAFAQLARVFSEHDASYHLHLRTFVVADVAEAAVRCGQHAVARGMVGDLEPLALQTHSPILRAGLLIARPLLARDEDAEALFRVALDDGLPRWPMHRARVHLEYGSWLRRQRRVFESREPLRVAHETFAGLGAEPWAERAAQELRAAGDAPPEMQTAAWEHLTAQEYQIAMLAAQGLTNRQIGERLLLSHRTVGAHLYHIFPKLGISSRGQLSAVLADRVSAGEGGLQDAGA
jgi:DNA-binding CsgD family transcriptional regulator/tetratricopeptide (TPR) repeat protein